MIIRCEGKRWRAHGSVASETCPDCRAERQEIEMDARRHLYAYEGAQRPTKGKVEAPPVTDKKETL